MGSHFLGANLEMVTNNPEVVKNVIGPNIGNQDLMETASKQGNLVPQLINLMSDTAPWLVGLLSVCALAACSLQGQPTCQRQGP